MKTNKNNINIYNLIILVLLIVFIFILYNKYYNKSGFEVNRNNIIGNLIHTSIITVPNLEITFAESYKIAGFIFNTDSSIIPNNTVKIKFNNTFLRIEGQDDLKANQFYDLTNMNIVTKSLNINNKQHGNIFVYGMPLDNKLEPANYTNAKLLSENEVVNTSGTINFDKDLLVNYIVLKNDNDTSSDNIRIQYTNSYQEDLKQVRGFKEFDNKYASNSKRIYFHDNYLIKQLNLDNITSGTKIDIYGAIPTEKDLIEYRVKSEIQDNTNAVVDNAKCPAMGKIIETQSLINDMCNTLLEKDKMRNYKTIYEKQKKYLRILKTQNDEISNLEFKLKNLISENNMSNDVQLKSDYRQIKEELQKLTEEHTNVLENIKVIDTSIQQGAETIASSAENNPLSNEL